MGRGETHRKERSMSVRNPARNNTFEDLEIDARDYTNE
jgi:hypothetical protein